MPASAKNPDLIYEIVFFHYKILSATKRKDNLSMM